MNQDLIVDKEHTPISLAVEYSALDSSRPPAVICDLDGTLALITDRDPYDAEFCINDQLNVPVADLIKAENKNGAAIVLVSGRSESSRSDTIAWLKKEYNDVEKYINDKYVKITGNDEVLKRLLKKFNYNHRLATVAYNMGPGWTRGRLRNNLPVGNRNEYLDKVQRAYKRISKKI